MRLRAQAEQQSSKSLSSVRARAEHEKSIRRRGVQGCSRPSSSCKSGCELLGKGIVAASLGKLLQARGYSVTILKFDPYINIDPGTLSPFEEEGAPLQYLSLESTRRIRRAPSPR